MIDSPYFKEMQRNLDQYTKDLQEQERSLKMKALNEDNISKKYFELMNLIGIKNQIIRRMEALEYVMEAYPSSFTLSEVKEQLMDTDIKYEKLIRNFIVDCLNNKE